mmetsp:Transcript_9485/g.19996  ORF Transcript_9485/g.19996 Transcript_9485/m.19996 type:complete len:345 (-) Transcript_9485:107-1141(-)
MPGRPPPFTTLVLHTWREHGKPRPWDKRDGDGGSASSQSNNNTNNEPKSTPSSARVVSSASTAYNNKHHTGHHTNHYQHPRSATALLSPRAATRSMTADSVLASCNGPDSVSSTPGGRPPFPNSHHHHHTHANQPAGHHHSHLIRPNTTNAATAGAHAGTSRRGAGAHELRSTFSMTHMAGSSSSSALINTSDKVGMRRVQSNEAKLDETGNTVLAPRVRVASCDFYVDDVPMSNYGVTPAARSAAVAAERRAAALASGVRSPGLSALAFDMFEDDSGDDFGTGSTSAAGAAAAAAAVSSSTPSSSIHQHVISGHAHTAAAASLKSSPGMMRPSVLMQGKLAKT